jgi:uncharacterized protein YdaU (DUF1376 family)
VNGLPYYKAYPRDFIEGTIGMSFELKGAYRLVLDLIYMQNGRLPDDARYISGQLGCTVRAWNGYRAKLIEMGKLRAENGVISNFRANLELDKLAEISRKNAESARLPRKNNTLEEANAKRTLSHTEPDTDTEIKKEIGKPISSRFDEFWQVWPVKKGKAPAEKAWAKMRQGDRSEAIAKAADWFAQWRRQYPDASPILPATFLNGRRWEDEFSAPRVAPAARIFSFNTSAG